MEQGSQAESEALAREYRAEQHRIEQRLRDAQRTVTSVAGVAVQAAAQATAEARERASAEPTRDGDARRQWTALAIATATFSVLFWLAAAAGVGRAWVGGEASAGAYPRGVLVAYLVCVTVGGVALVSTAGYFADRFTRSLPAAVGAAVFLILGFAAGMVPALAVAGLAPGLRGLFPAMALFAAPVALAAAFSRVAVGPVLRRPGLERLAWALALAPTALLIAWAVGLLVATGADAMRAG